MYQRCCQSPCMIRAISDIRTAAVAASPLPLLAPGHRTFCLVNPFAWAVRRAAAGNRTVKSPLSPIATPSAVRSRQDHPNSPTAYERTLSKMVLVEFLSVFEADDLVSLSCHVSRWMALRTAAVKSVRAAKPRHDAVMSVALRVASPPFVEW